MKIASNSYEHEPGITLYLVPETDVERVLLQMLWKHGRLERVYPPAQDKVGSHGFAITAIPLKQETRG